MNDSITAAVYRGDKSFTVEKVIAVPPGPGEVQVRIAYCGICGTDMHVFHGNMDARVGFERVIGHEMSGVVNAVGGDVSGLSQGQKVVVRPLDHCGACPACIAGHTHVCHKLKFLGLDTNGAMQELWTVPAHTIHKLPDDLKLDHAASDAAGDLLGPEENSFWRDHKSAKVNALRTKTLIEQCDIAVIRFGDKYKQWNAAFDAGYCAAMGTPYITLHSEDIIHPLKEVDAAAYAWATTPDQVVEILNYVVGEA